MDHLPSALSLSVAGVSVVALYLAYTAVTTLYENFLDFSRRFRGVE